MRSCILSVAGLRVRNPRLLDYAYLRALNIAIIQSIIKRAMKQPLQVLKIRCLVIILCYIKICIVLISRFI